MARFPSPRVLPGGATRAGEAGSADKFICPHSGVCVPRAEVCDGSASIPSCTDELFCDACPPAHFACDVCVPG
ncbi:hypothetical protein E2C01_100513 [Portunus trituberculatus]|uniref:Uncharacterized protein n=1 Tax=Portunus trituberculatus TaxID=210409 RepID=A0A5B7KDH9_PORTR|nr:hypothetical protein [Portunus trituberculatus]